MVLLYNQLCPVTAKSELVAVKSFVHTHTHTQTHICITCIESPGYQNYPWPFCTTLVLTKFNAGCLTASEWESYIHHVEVVSIIPGSSKSTQIAHSKLLQMMTCMVCVICKVNPLSSSLQARSLNRAQMVGLVQASQLIRMHNCRNPIVRSGNTKCVESSQNDWMNV